MSVSETSGRYDCQECGFAAARYIDLLGEFEKSLCSIADLACAQFDLDGDPPFIIHLENYVNFKIFTVAIMQKTAAGVLKINP